MDPNNFGGTVHFGPSTTIVSPPSVSFPAADPYLAGTVNPAAGYGAVLNTPFPGVPVVDNPAVAVPLAGVPLAGTSVAAVPLAGAPVAAVPLGGAPLAGGYIRPAF